jgi:hypothetical protein
MNQGGTLKFILFSDFFLFCLIYILFGLYLVLSTPVPISCSSFLTMDYENKIVEVLEQKGAVEGTKEESEKKYLGRMVPSLR